MKFLIVVLIIILVYVLYRICVNIEYKYYLKKYIKLQFKWAEIEDKETSDFVRKKLEEVFEFINNNL